MIQKRFLAFSDNCELNDQVFGNDPVCNDYDDTSIMFDDELSKFVNLNGDNRHPNPIKVAFQKLLSKTTISKSSIC